jgi:taurine dioxygenase
VTSTETEGLRAPPVGDGLRFERVTANIGAIVHGVDVHVPQPDGVASKLRQSLPEHGVLFFYSDTLITAEEFRTFATIFGEPYAYPYGSGRGQFENENGSGAERSRTNCWHTDGSAQEIPPQAALLSPVHLPTAGGDTMWANTATAFDALSSRLQRTLDGLSAVHSTDRVARFYEEGRGKAVFGEGESHIHPVVITHPVTRRKGLYVNSNYTERLLGLSEHESDRLLEMLFAHINTPEFHVRLRWQPNMIAVWEERVTQHRAVADYTERRVMRRIVIRSDNPPA